MTPLAAHPPIGGTRGPLEILARVAGHAGRRACSPAIRAVTLTHPERVITWGELHEKISSVASRLRAMELSGRVVLLSCPNQPEFIVAFLAVLAAGGWVMPVNPRETPAELLRLAGLTRAAAIIGTDEAIGALGGLGIKSLHVETLLQEHAPVISVGNSESTRGGLLLQNSGTTGMPRIAVRPGPSLDAVAANVVAAANLSHDDDVLVCIPLSHSYGVENGLLGPILAGACIRLIEGFDPQVVLHHLRNGVTVFPGVPFMFEALARARTAPPIDPPAALRLAYSAGAIMPGGIAAEFERRFRVGVGQLYGATEIGSVTFNHPASGGFDPACAGAPLAGVRILVLDSDDPDPRRPLPIGTDGHIAVSAPSMLTRYLDGDAPITGGFFLSGDLGRIDDLGRLWITGRLKLQIDVGGLKVNPIEVEGALLEHRAVAECVVVAMPLSDTISRVRAVVVRKPGAAVTPNEIRRYLSERLAPHKVPRLIEFRDTLPRSALGKVLRREVELS